MEEEATQDEPMVTNYCRGCEAAAKREQELVEALDLFLRSTHEHNDYCSMGAVYKCNCLLGELKRTARHALDTIKRNADASHS